MGYSVKPIPFDKEYAMIQLDDLHKQGYASITSYPSLLRNEYRELTAEQSVDTVNQWIKIRKIKAELLHILYSKTNSIIVKDSDYKKIKGSKL